MLCKIGQSSQANPGEFDGLVPYLRKQAAIRSELASRFSTSMGAATATEANRAPKATAFRENFMVRCDGNGGGGRG